MCKTFYHSETVTEFEFGAYFLRPKYNWFVLEENVTPIPYSEVSRLTRLVCGPEVHEKGNITKKYGCSEEKFYLSNPLKTR